MSLLLRRKQASLGRDSLPMVDLAGHHSLCEMNFHRLLKMVPQLRDGRDKWSFTMGVRSDIHVEIKTIDLAPYTSTIEITQNLSGIISSNLQVRLYHDVEMAEIVAWDRHRNWRPRYDYPNPKMYHPDEKLELNKFLSDWLLFCSREGNAGRQVCELVLVNKK